MATRKQELESIRAERKFEADDAIKVWWASVCQDPRFTHVIMATEGRMSLREKIQQSPHAQHVAGGFRLGFHEALRIMRELPYEEGTSSSVEASELEHQQDPDLTDDPTDNAERRFRR